MIMYDKVREFLYKSNINSAILPVNFYQGFGKYAS